MSKHHNIIVNIVVSNLVEAIAFYKKVFKTKVKHIHYDEKILLTPTTSRNIIHAILTINNVVISISELITRPNLKITPPTLQGNNIKLFILFKNYDELENVYHLLKKNNSTIILPLDPKKETQAIIQDKYGITWQLALYKVTN
ncbi:VOC family protein [Candidatus Hepatincola sp. Pdp]